MRLHLRPTRDIACLLVIGYGMSALTNHNASYPQILSFNTQYYLDQMHVCLMISRLNPTVTTDTHSTLASYFLSSSIN